MEKAWLVWKDSGELVATVEGPAKAVDQYLTGMIKGLVEVTTENSDHLPKSEAFLATTIDEEGRSIDCQAYCQRCGSFYPAKELPDIPKAANGDWVCRECSDKERKGA